ncbi:hypothetical protein KW517_10205 [Vibrio fluvialis]|nr:hypothetical protein [Vibrio fluvialis]HCK0611287.1 hypothetical protein [Vibrio parahaemolyticus]
MDSPLEKITDPSFTSSAKGLMTLFGVGLTHLVIGVNMDDVKIAIPWLPTINFEHPERLIYLYWALVWYALYRYTLHNKNVFGGYYFKSLAKVLEIGQKGEKFVRDTVYLSNHYYTVTENYHDGSYEISIESSVDDGSETAFAFSFFFTRDYSFKKISCWENPALDIDDLVIHNESVRSKWGLTSYATDSELIHETTKIDSMRLRYKLRYLVLSNYFNEMKFNKDIFDTTVPIILNLSLFFVWLGTSL